jgi:hypothetical protein
MEFGRDLLDDVPTLVLRRKRKRPCQRRLDDARQIEPSAHNLAIVIGQFASPIELPNAGVTL